MNALKYLHNQILKEQTRIEILKNTKSNGDPEWYDFVNKEIRSSKTKIAELKKQFDQEYELHN